MSKNSPIGPHQGKALTKEELQFVAELYKDAVGKRISTHQHVADELGIALSTAAKRIMQARKAGFIGKIGWYGSGDGPYCSFKISKKEMDELTRLAQAKRVNRSEVIREAINAYIQQNKNLLEKSPA